MAEPPCQPAKRGSKATMPDYFYLSPADSTFGLGPRPSEDRVGERAKTAVGLVGVIAVLLPLHHPWSVRLLDGAVVLWMFIGPARGVIWDLRVKSRRAAKRRLQVERERAIACVRRAVALVKAHADASSNGRSYASEIMRLPDGLPPEKGALAYARRDVLIQACSFQRHLTNEVTADNLLTVSRLMQEVAQQSIRGLDALLREVVINDQKQEAAERIREYVRSFIESYNSLTAELVDSAPCFATCMSRIPLEELPSVPKIRP